MEAEPLIVMDHVSFQYSSQTEPTLKDVSLTINRGEKVLIAGPSGSGKSTLGELLNGLIPEEFAGDITGQITINDTSLKDLNLFDLSFEVGTVLQDPDHQFVGLTVAEDIAFALENDQVPNTELHQKVQNWADQLELAALLANHPQEISGGQKQRVALAGVLINEEPILLLDEPLANLDPASGASSIELLDSLCQIKDLTLIIIDHRIEEVLHRPIDRLVLLNDGQVAANDVPDQVLRSGIMPKLGLREPLYLAALQQAGEPLSTLHHLDDLTQLTIADDGLALKQWDQAHQLPANTTPTTPLLEINQLQFGYDNQHPIFNNFSLQINQGELVALVGKNGTGKTTLSSLITGFLTLTGGQLQFDGQTMNDWSVKERADHIGYILQDPNQMISQHMIFDEVALGLRLRHIPEDEIKTRVYDILKVTGLYEFRNWPIAALSFGQKKRVTIASILILKPQMLILDEPTAGQDLAHYSQMLNFLEDLNQQQHITIIFITHDMHLMLEYADRAIVLDQGQVLLDATPAEVLTNQAVIQRANLVETSLQQLGEKVGLPDPIQFAQKYVAFEKGVRRHE